MKRIWDAFRGMGLERPRVALALLPLSLFGLQYLFSAIAGDPEVRAVLMGMAACYLLAFVALASEWFWARWFASGLGWSGAVMGLFALVLIPEPELRVIFGIFAGLHALVVVMLMGKKMAARYDMQPAWRERFGMDEFGVVRLGRAVTRASAALPGLIFWALGPRNPDPDFLVYAAAGLAIVGLTGLLRLRTWGVLALGGAAAAIFTAAPAGFPLPHTLLGLPDPMSVASALPGIPAALALLLFAATLPFIGGAIRYYRSLR
jgi:hypothetical protein